MSLDDLYTPYERGIANFLRRLGSAHPRYLDLVTLQTRLMENITAARMFGSQNQAERLEVITQINRLCVPETGLPFHAFCQAEPETSSTISSDSSDIDLVETNQLVHKMSFAS